MSTYFMIDGSCFFARISDLRSRKTEYTNKKLKIDKFVNYMVSKWLPYCKTIVRINFYFKKNDKRIKNFLIVPFSNIPNSKNHWQFKECGESLKAIPDEELKKLAPQYREIFPRSEKGLDIKLVCDTLQLVANNKADSIVLFVNDSDYIPLFETLQNLGVNVYLTGLSSKKNINKKLADLADMYQTLDEHLGNIFI